MAPEQLRSLLEDRVLVLDGGLATELEQRGHDLSSHLWSAALLAGDPAAVRAAHVAYLRAGADIVTTASYQASAEGFGRAGVGGRRAERLLRDSVRLADQARQQVLAETPGRGPLLVAASVGPYGAVLADGSEYTGDYGRSVDDLRRFHRPRLEVLADAGADVLACETVPCLAEVEALLAEIDRLEGAAAWLSVTVDGDRTRRGEPATDAFAMAADVPAVVAVGANCCAPGDVRALVARAAVASGKPVVAYPNSGQGWDPAAGAWTGPTRFDPAQARAWVADGARVVGGCCRVGPPEIARIAAVVRGASG